MLPKMTDEYRRYANKLILTSVFTIVLSSALSSLITSAIAAYLPASLGIVAVLGEIIFASVGLWWINKNGKRKSHSLTKPQQ